VKHVRVRKAGIGVAAAMAAVLVAAAATTGGAAPVADPTIVAVGDIACQSLQQNTNEGACRSGEVASLVTQLNPTRFLPLGDLQYSKGSLDEFQRVWDVQFGALKPITAPVPGNHEYTTPGGGGYFDYFGSAAHGPSGYYSYDLGAWHIVALNSAICGTAEGCGPGSPQYEWLAADLAAHRSAACTLAYQHHPPFDWRPWQKFVDPDEDGPNAGSEVVGLRDLWSLMDGASVDVLLVGHNHMYQRWAAQDVSGVRDADGIVEFIVGTGGRSLYPLGKKPRPKNIVAIQNKAFGALQLTLHARSYDYRWVGLPTDPRFIDAGSITCR
jgi:calcineurin-like phosphoesterase family protein